MKVNGPGRSKLGSGQSYSYMAIFWPTPDFKGKTFWQLWLLKRGDLNFCVPSTPLWASSNNNKKEATHHHKLSKVLSTLYLHFLTRASLDAQCCKWVTGRISSLTQLSVPDFSSWVASATDMCSTLAPSMERMWSPTWRAPLLEQWTRHVKI